MSLANSLNNLSNLNMIIDSSGTQDATHHRHQQLQKKRNFSQMASSGCVADFQVSKKQRTQGVPNLWQNLSPQLKGFVDVIESYLTKQKISEPMLTQIRLKMEFVVKHAGWSEEKKMMELGVLHFYVTARMPIPGEESLFNAWKHDVDQAASALNDKNKDLCGKTKARILPSGATMYIQNQFSCMIFTSDGKFNAGGCLAVKMLLNSRVGRFFGEQQRLQMLRILDRLLYDRDFLNQFRATFAVHPDLQKLMRIDMQLQMDAPLNALSVRRDLLLCFFSLIGQDPDAANCYAVGAEINLLSQHCNLLLKQLIKVLKTGMLEFEGTQIPIATLLEGRRIYEEDFETQLAVDKAPQLAGFIIASDILGRKMSADTSQAPTATLGECMQNTFGKKYEDAQEIFLSLKQNLLQQMLVSILQFISLNTIPNEGLTMQDVPPSEKELLLLRVKQSIFADFMKLPEVASLNLQAFFDRIEDILPDYFFLVDCKNRKKINKGNRVTFDFHQQGLLFESNFSYDPFLEERRLYYLSNGTLVPVDSLSFFGTCLSEIASKIVGPSATQNELRALSEFATYVKGEAFKQATARIVDCFNNTEIIKSPKTYYDSDAFFLIQSGGDTQLILLWDLFKNCYKEPVAFSSKNSCDFFTQLCQSMESAKTQNEMPSAKYDACLLVESQDHTFNLNPSHFEKYWNAPQGYVKTMVERAEKILSQPITSELARKILIDTVGEKKVSSYLKKSLPTNIINIKEWIKRVSYLIDKSQLKKLEKVLEVNKFEKALDQFLQEIDFQTIRKDIFSVLLCGGIQLNYTQQAEVSAYFANKKEIKFMTPYQLAKLLQKSLLTCGYSGNSQLHHLEETICAYYSFPEVIDLGNLNYVDQSSEKLNFRRLVFKYDFLKQSVTICSRVKGIASKLPNDFMKALFEEFTLYFETNPGFVS